MIARLWRGVTPAHKAQAYLDYLKETGVSDSRAAPGNRGVYVLRRAEGNDVEFLVLTLWESMEAIRKLAGEDAERAVYYPEDEAFLVSQEARVRHYEVDIPT